MSDLIEKTNNKNKLKLKKRYASQVKNNLVNNSTFDGIQSPKYDFKHYLKNGMNNPGNFYKKNEPSISLTIEKNNFVFNAFKTKNVVTQRNSPENKR